MKFLRFEGFTLFHETVLVGTATKEVNHAEHSRQKHNNPYAPLHGE